MKLNEYIKREIRKLVTEDYDRSMKLQEFNFINRLDGWFVKQNGEDNFSLIHKQGNINIIVTPCKDTYNYHGKGPIAKQFPWDTQILALHSGEPLKSRGNGCTRNFEKTFEHYLKWFFSEDAAKARKLAQGR